MRLKLVGKIEERLGCSRTRSHETGGNEILERGGQCDLSKDETEWISLNHAPQRVGMRHRRSLAGGEQRDVAKAYETDTHQQYQPCHGNTPDEPCNRQRPGIGAGVRRARNARGAERHHHVGPHGRAEITKSGKRQGDPRHGVKTDHRKGPAEQTREA